MITPILESIETWRLSVGIAESGWLFPALESAHVIAIAIVVGAIFRLDFRMIGINRGPRTIAEIAADVLPWVWGAFVLAVVSGLGMFISTATTYGENPAFLIKMVMLALAGVNMLTFHLITDRQPANAPSRTTGVRIAGGLSLLFWTAVVVLGRWIGFI